MSKGVSPATAFDEFAQEYDRWFETHPYTYKSELKAVRRFVSGQGLGVEIGVGTGRFSVPLGITIGVEPSKSMAAIARSRGVEVIRAKAEKLPFVSTVFDMALLVNVICFLADPLASLKETHRILRPGGGIILGFIDKATKLGKRYESLKVASKFYNHATFFSAQQVKHFLREIGFGCIQSCQTIFAGPDEMAAVEPARQGYGKGGFAVISGLKK